MLICFGRTRKLFFTSNQKNELSQENKTYIDISNGQFELFVYFVIVKVVEGLGTIVKPLLIK